MARSRVGVYLAIVLLLASACDAETGRGTADAATRDSISGDTDPGSDARPGGDSAGAEGGPLDAGSQEGGAREGGAPDAGSPDAGAPDAAAGACVQAKKLWFDDFETGDYSRWTSSTYGDSWNGGLCHGNGFSSQHAKSPTHSHRSEITCAIDQSHRGYGGVQFSGDTPLAAYTNKGTGIDAPHGVVNTYWSWLEVPYSFGSGKWFSFWTVNNSCDWTDSVITLGLEDPSNRLTPAHIKNTGGTVTFTAGAPGFPLGQWVRTTIYINYHSGVMHVWQDGKDLIHATFSRPTKQICQWHWGAYASKDNTNIDNSIWKLEQPWTDFTKEPYLGVTVAVCP